MFYYLIIYEMSRGNLKEAKKEVSRVRLFWNWPIWESSSANRAARMEMNGACWCLAKGSDRC